MGRFTLRKGYNLYYKNKKINSRILSARSANELLKRNHITCINNVTNERIIVPINDVTCVECIMV